MLSQFVVSCQFRFGRSQALFHRVHDRLRHRVRVRSKHERGFGHRADAVASLTNLDVVMGVCAPVYIKERGDGLCREMYCLAQANSTTGAATEKSCDAISNVNNSLVIVDVCLKLDSQARLDCLTVFRERK